MKRYIIGIMCFIFTSNILFAQKNTEILWDNYGVPHVYAKNQYDMYYAFGWAQMHNHANLLLQLYAQARGQAAEYWGEKFLASDKTIHLFNLPDSAKAHYNKYSNEYKTIINSFAKGINDYAKAHPDNIDSIARLVLPITPYDVLAHDARVVCLQFLAAADIQNTQRLLAPGSNAYAIGPSKSASKNAMLVANPHLPWSDLYLFFEAHLSAPGFTAYGASLLGQPILNIAFNNNLGWTLTVNTIDASDRYELKMQDGGYLLDGKTENFHEKLVKLKVRQRDGSLLELDTTFHYSRHGPVLGEKNGKAYAIRIAGLENPFRLVQWHQMSKAKNWKEFEGALKMLQSPMFNVIYADKAGNILYLFNGNVPVRTEGDWRFWNGTIDGTVSKYIWHQYHKYDELPQVFNPSGGFVQNANDPPWTSTFPTLLNPKKFPAYMAPQVMAFRPQRAVNMIKDDASITFDELIAYKLNTGMEAADRFLDDLLDAVKRNPDAISTNAAEVLKKWDRSTNTDSRGAVLFARWFDMMKDSMFARPW
ncbi:MAG: penicillin acylase family protein, partial [Ferruginibacter sp.]|nr:penicillin acylase family protein [Chitinophagaceae bacterium]